MKKIYFVRHGATGGNEKNEFQHGHIELSELGKKQAKIVADRFKSLPVDVILASDMNRASQTADVIGKAIKRKVIYSSLFQEILRPSSVRGKSKDEPEVATIMKDVKANFGNEEWHHSDEENFFDLRRRAVSALEYIKSLKEDNVMVVTHGNFLIMLIAVMGFGDEFSPQQYKKMQKYFIPKNTGITIVDEHKGEYFLLTWNDYAHLGDTDIKFVYS